MSLPRLLSSPEAQLVLILALIIVSAVGLILARELLPRGRARRAALAGFIVLLVTCGVQLVVWIISASGRTPEWWKKTLGSLNTTPFIPLIPYTLGFALLTVAIFSGRKPVQRDADAG